MRSVPIFFTYVRPYTKHYISDVNSNQKVVYNMWQEIAAAFCRMVRREKFVYLHYGELDKPLWIRAKSYFTSRRTRV